MYQSKGYQATGYQPTMSNSQRKTNGGWFLISIGILLAFYILIALPNHLQWQETEGTLSNPRVSEIINTSRRSSLTGSLTRRSRFYGGSARTVKGHQVTCDVSYKVSQSRHHMSGYQAAAFYKSFSLDAADDTQVQAYQKASELLGDKISLYYNRLEPDESILPQNYQLRGLILAAVGGACAIFIVLGFTLLRLADRE